MFSFDGVGVYFKGELTLLTQEKETLEKNSQKQSSLLTVVKSLRKERQDLQDKVSQLETEKVGSGTDTCKEGI